MKFLCFLYTIATFLFSITNQFEKEKDLLLTMKQNIEKQIQLLEILHPKLNVDNMIIKDTSESINIIQPEVKYSNKKLQLVEYYNTSQLKLGETEKIIGIHLMGYRYHFDKTAKFKRIPLILVVTNRKFYVIKENEIITSAEILAGNVEILKVDFTDFGEDDNSNIVVYTNTSEISVLTVAMYVKISQEEVIYSLTIRKLRLVCLSLLEELLI
jgi:hypothetical protein